MAQRKTYNPNTAYKFRKLKEQAQINYQDLTPKQKTELDVLDLDCLLIMIIIVLLYVAITGDWKGALWWMSK